MKRFLIIAIAVLAIFSMVSCDDNKTKGCKKTDKMVVDVIAVDADYVRVRVFDYDGDSKTWKYDHSVITTPSKIEDAEVGKHYHIDGGKYVVCEATHELEVLPEVCNQRRSEGYNVSKIVSITGDSQFAYYKEYPYKNKYKSWVDVGGGNQNVSSSYFNPLEVGYEYHSNTITYTYCDKFHEIFTLDIE